MLKKIAVSQACLGMHLHKLEGPWLGHSLWKTRFVIDNAEDLQRLQSSGVAECWIDPALGCDVPPAHAAAATVAALVATAATADAADTAASPPPRAAPQAERPLADELKQAAAICQQGRQAVTAIFNQARMGRAVDAERCLPLVTQIALSVQRNPGALVSLARLKSKDDYSYMHSVAVCALMVALARQMGMDDDSCRNAGAAGLLHDIGKAVMPPSILNKPGKLTDAEYSVMRSHPQRGHALLAEGRGVSEQALDVVLHHHEKMDGSGYPHGLAGDPLSQWARMGAICDVYDAITSNRPYKAAWDPAESIARMVGWKGHFDAKLLGAFVQSLGIYPIGSLVRLQSGHLAVVLEQNPHKLVAPVVKVFYSIYAQLPVPVQRLDLAANGCSDCIVAREKRQEGRFERLDELWLDPDVLRRSRSTR